MARPATLITCHVRKNVRVPVEVSTPEGPATAQRGDYIVTDAEGGQWVFTESQFREIRSAQPSQTPPPGQPQPPA